MVRVFCTQKTEQLIEKLEQWQNLFQKKIKHDNQELSDNRKMCALDKRIKIETPTLRQV